MITAKQAKELYDQSGQEITDFLTDNVEPRVKEAAAAGKRVVFIYLGNIERFNYLEHEITPVQKAAIEKLQELGYRARIVVDGDKYVPCGLADDDGDGPLYQNYGIQVGW